MRLAFEQNTFGGAWTVEKLNILEKYLDAYTTALKNQPFRLIYIDAFAGSGRIEIPDQRGGLFDEFQTFINGSATRALQIKEKPFDELIFVDKNPDRCHKLEHLRQQFSSRNICIINIDANEFLSDYCGNQTNSNDVRGVLFLDPYATTVQWSTIEKIADTNAFDMWILFPVYAISRMLPTHKEPDDISAAWAQRLTAIYGDESWQELYDENDNLFGELFPRRTPGTEGFLNIYKRKLQVLFGDRYLDKSRPLKNSRNSVLFELMFCVGNSKGIAPAKRIANYILDHM